MLRMCDDVLRWMTMMVLNAVVMLLMMQIMMLTYAMRINAV